MQQQLPSPSRASSPGQQTTAAVRPPLNLQLPAAEIARRTAHIHHTLVHESTNVKTGNYQRIANSDLRRLFELYDQHFFGGYFGQLLKGRLRFRFSKRMTSAGGKTTYDPGSETFEICLSAPLMFQTFKDVQRPVPVNGLLCRDRLEATMRVLEHEIVHLFEFALFQKSSCSTRQFKRLSRNWFGHTAQTHQLVTQRERAWKRRGLYVGCRVEFSFEGRTHVGTIYRITKRATVMAPDPTGQYVDADGNHYAKFYLPLDWLTPVED